MLQLIGLIIKTFPAHMWNKSNEVLHLYTTVLKVQIESKKPEYKTIVGTILGMTYLLEAFPGDFVSDEDLVKDTFKFVFLYTLFPPSERKVYDVPKAGLQFVSSHAGLFTTYILSHCDHLYLQIANYCKHINKDIRYQGFRAMDALLETVLFVYL